MPLRARPNVVILTGPTASGKSTLALAVAEAVGGEIVSADSMQVYRHLDIGTAKPSAEDRARVPHHLVDFVELGDEYHVGRFREDADRAIREVSARGRVPLVVGGTALYLKVLTQGLAPAPARCAAVRAALDEEWERGGAGALWEELASADPALAGRLHPNDRTRVIRGLEVWRVAGQRLSDLQRAHGVPDGAYRVLWLGAAVGREELRQRIDRRVVAMMERGWLDEVRGVLAQGYPPTLPPLQALGYRQLSTYLTQGGDLAGAVAEIQAETRRFAKRQMTWFRGWSLDWFARDDAGGAARAVRKFLQTHGVSL